MTNPDLPHDPRFPAAQPPQVPQPPPFAHQPPPSHPGASPGWNDPNQPQFFESHSSGGHTIEETASSGSSVLGRIGLVIAALAVAGGGAFAVTRALSEPAGPQSPDEAVTQLFDAIENDDLLGLAEVMLPSEREALIEPMTDLVAELQRLDIVDADFDVESADVSEDGLDFSVTGLRYVTEPVGEGVVNVVLTGGEVRVEGQAADLPLGSRIEEELDGEDLEQSFSQGIYDFAEEEEARLTVVEEDGSWYVSLWYSVAEAGRAATDEPAPNFGNGIVPVGGDTPEDAIRMMFEAASDLDPEAVMAALDPKEFRALHDYAPLFLDEIEDVVADVRVAADDEGISWSIDRLELSSSEVRGRTIVTVDGFGFSAARADEEFALTFDGDCFTVVEGQSIDELCIEDFRDELGGSDLPDPYVDLFTTQQTGVTVVERDGQWFVSGFPTIIGAYTDLLASLEPQDIENLSDFFEASLDSAFNLSDPLFGQFSDGSDPFTPVEDFPVDEPGDDDPFDEDPFVQPELTADDLALFPEGWKVSTWDPTTAYFGGAIGLETLTYLEGYDSDTFGPTIYIERFDATADEINAGMAETFSYVEVDVEGLPAGATAWDWEDVDRAIVIDGFIIAAYFDDDGTAMALLTERARDVANR